MKAISFAIFLFTCLFLFNPSTGLAQIVPAPTDKQLQALDKFMAPHRKKVTDILEADKTGQYKTYLADLAALGETEDAATARELASKLKRDHYNFIKKAYTTAVINHEEMKRNVAKILGHNLFQIDEFGGILSSSVAPKLVLPLRFEAELSCPFSQIQEESNQNFISGCKVDIADCSMFLVARAKFDGGCRGKGSVGNKADLPEGDFNKITVSAQFDAIYFGYALSVGGYSKAEVKIGVRLQGPSFDQVSIVQENWCTAPVVWYSSFDVKALDFPVQAIFSGSFNGGNSFTAQVYNEVHAVAASPLTSATKVICGSSTFDFIRLVATN